MIFKAQGILGIPRDLWWIFNTLDPSDMRRYKPGEFAILTSTGCLGLGVFPELPWHKREKEHILKQLSIKVEYGEQIDYGKDKVTFRTLGDHDHSELIRDYIEGKGGMGKIAEAHGLSGGTVHSHVKKHNKELDQQGECPMCRRAESEYSKHIARRR